MLRPSPFLRRERPSVLRYGLAVLFVAGAVLLTRLLTSFMDTIPLLYAAVMISSWYGGRGPGLLSVLLATLAVDYYFVPPFHKLTLSTANLPYLSTFALLTLSVSFLSAARRRAEESLRQARDEMEAKVLERTAALKQTNEKLQGEIAERRGTEESLRESERRYRHIFQTAGVSIWEADFSQVKAAIDNLKAQGVRDFRQYLAAHPEFVRQAIPMVKIVDVNDAAVRLFGAQSKDELLASLPKVFLTEAQEVFARELIAIAEGRTSFESETVRQTLRGDKLVVLFTITFPPQPANLDSVLVSIMDITERKRAEEAVRRQANLLEQAHDAIFVWEFPSIIIYWNRGAERLYGFSREEAIGRHSHELLQTEHPMPSPLFEATLERKGEWTGELTHTTREGRKVIIESRHVLMREADGRRLVLETNRDITERKHAEEALRKAQAELAHVTRVTTLGELTASIAHEINQPLAAVVTNGNACLRWLAGQVPNLEEARQALGRIIKDGNRASQVIGRIRALVKKTAPRKDWFNINEVILEVIALARSEVRRNHVSLRSQLSEHLPLVVGDRIQLQQVILNLITNGIEAMRGVSEGSRDLLISSGRFESNGVLVLVRDSGIGLDSVNLDHLFDSFYTTKPDGMGMGLAISRSIIEAHGGRLWATPNAPQGAVFQFTLPPAREKVS
jgi:two-component system sensor kinase FixL